MLAGVRVTGSPTHDVTLAVLAGGQGRRMGLPKANLRVGGRPILELLWEQLAWPGPALLVTAPGRQHPAGWQRFDREVCDPVSGQGPLRGILTALEATETRYVLVTPVDMPLVTADHLNWLADELRHRPGVHALLLSRGDDPDRAVEPFPSAYDVAVLPTVFGLLAGGARAVRSLVREGSVATVPAPAAWDDNFWLNINTPSDLAGYLATRPGRRTGVR